MNSIINEYFAVLATFCHIISPELKKDRPLIFVDLLRIKMSTDI